MDAGALCKQQVNALWTCGVIRGTTRSCPLACRRSHRHLWKPGENREHPNPPSTLHERGLLHNPQHLLPLLLDTSPSGGEGCTVKFRCERDVLADALATAGRAATGRTGTLPVLSGLRLELVGDKLT